VYGNYGSVSRKCGKCGKLGKFGKERVGRPLKVGEIIVPVSFWKCLPFLLTFSSLKLKKWDFSSDKNAKISICQYFLDIISKP
jgi:hypothetical protein